MVVQFPPAGASPDHPHRRRAPQAAEDGLAPVTYLPGAQPSAASRDALDRVRAVAEVDSETATPARDRKASRAGNVAIHQLARRGMSRWELEQVLARRDVDEQTAAAELDRLESVGLLDDAALAVSVVYAMHTRKGAGRAAIESELRRRHLDAVVIEEAMSELDGDDELQRATELAATRARQFSGLEYDVAARRLSGFLSRKGYDGEVVRGAVRAALENHPRGGSPGGGRVRFR